MRYDLGSGNTAVSQSQATLNVNTAANGNLYYVVLHAGTPNNGAAKGTGLVRANESGASSFGSVEIAKYSLDPAGPFNLFSAVKWVDGEIAPGSIAAKCKGKFYRFTVKDVDGVTVKCDIVPAKRVSDGLVGLFDVVSNEFLTPNGTFTQYGEMEAEGGTVSARDSSHESDLTVGDPSRVTSSPASGLNIGYVASVLFNNNYVHAMNTSQRFIMSGDNLPLTVDYDFGDGTPQAVDSYKIYFGTGSQTYAHRAPKAWKFYGSNDKTEWTPLDERTSETGWSYNNDCRAYSFQNDTPYRWYRLEVTAAGGPVNVNDNRDHFLELVQLEYFRSGRLCINVPENTATTNTAISIVGKVVVEKDGPGTLNMAKKNMGFGGSGFTSLVVRNGKVTRPPNRILATLGAAKSVIAVLDGGQFDLAGFNYYDYRYTLAGNGPDGRGALVNDVLAAGFQNQGAWYADIWNGFLGDVTLAADATIGGTETFGMLWYAAKLGNNYAASKMTMNGHTLTYAMPLPKVIYSWSLYNYIGEGRIVIAEGCQFSFTMGDANRPTSAPECDMIVAGTLNQNNLGATVKSLSFTETGTYTHSTVKPITVYEKYAPNINSTENKNKHPTVTLGAGGHTETTLDLSLFSDTFDSRYTTFYAGSTVTVDTGTRVLAAGSKLVSWALAPNNVTFVLKNAEALKFEVFTTESGLYLRPTATPAYAKWDLDAEAWKFYSSDDEDVTQYWTQGVTSLMQVRFGSLAEYAAITNASAGIAPAAYVLTGLPLETGTEKIDLSVLDLVVEDGVEIDVKSNSLTLPGSAMGGGAAFTVTSSVEGGELVVDVPEEITVENTNVSLTGLLRFVKRGAGTFIPTKLYQTYTGGNVIEAGTVKLSVAHNQYDGYFNELGGGYQFESTKAQYADVEILPGATVDQNGQTGVRSYMFILKGGTLKNSRVDIATNQAMLFDFRLDEAERSYWQIANSTGFYKDLGGPTSLDLGGKTLQVGIAAGKNLYLRNTTISNGVLDVVSGGYLYTIGAASTIDADVNLGCALRLEQPLSVRSIAVKFNGDWDVGTAALKVYGAFRPETEGGYFYGPTMQDGSTLDFSAWPADLGWPVYSRSQYVWGTKVNNTLSFADGARVTVKLDGRDRRELRAMAEDDGTYLLKWDTQTANYESATFSLDAGSSKSFRLVKDAEGLRFCYKLGFAFVVR